MVKMHYDGKRIVEKEEIDVERPTKGRGSGRGSGGFKRGGPSPNPNGRPIGALSKRTKEYLKVKELAAGSYEKMFKVLLEKGLAGEAWAQQLYYKEFIPKRAKEETVVLVEMGNTLRNQISALTTALAKFEEVTYDEAVDRLKVLAALNLSDAVGNQTDEMRETKETLIEKVEMFNRMIDLKRANVFKPDKEEGALTVLPPEDVEADD